ncbi:MAG TPA: SHOCT domain-containing protein [Actinomycetes bacterium]
MMWGWNGWAWWGWALMSLSMVAFWGLVIWGIVALFRRPADRWPGDGRREEPDPERILGERFARGEIDEEEYHRRLQTLHSTNGRPADLPR